MLTQSQLLILFIICKYIAVKQNWNVQADLEGRCCVFILIIM